MTRWIFQNQYLGLIYTTYTIYRVFATCIFLCGCRKKNMLLLLLLFFYEKIPKSVNVYWKSIKFVLPEWKICFWYNYCAYLQAPANIETETVSTPNPNRKTHPRQKKEKKETFHTLMAFLNFHFSFSFFEFISRATVFFFL